MSTRHARASAVESIRWPRSAFISWRSLAEIHLRIGVEHTANGDVPIGDAGHRLLGEYWLGIVAPNSVAPVPALRNTAAPTEE
jgi:hypothetical protein